MSNRNPFGVLFVTTLVLSWTLISVVFGVAVWSDRHASLVRLGTWASLWTFTVVVPTLNALAVHRSVGDLKAEPDGDQVTPLDRLARLRPLLLLSANMAVLSAFALIFGR